MHKSVMTCEVFHFFCIDPGGGPTWAPQSVDERMIGWYTQYTLLGVISLVVFGVIDRLQDKRVYDDGLNFGDPQSILTERT